MLGFWLSYQCFKISIEAVRLGPPPCQNRTEATTPVKLDEKSASAEWPPHIRLASVEATDMRLFFFFFRGKTKLFFFFWLKRHRFTLSLFFFFLKFVKHALNVHLLIAKIGTSSGQRRFHFLRQQATSTSIISRRFSSSFSPAAATSFSPAAGDSFSFSGDFISPSHHLLQLLLLPHSVKCEVSVSSPKIEKMEDEEQTLQKKHQLMLERLSARHQTRLETLKSDPSDSSTTSAFLSRFNDSKKSIAAQIESSVDPSRLPDISVAISDLEKFVAENSYLLPSYEIRSSLKTISDLKQSLENLTSQLIPKKKFSFNKSKPTKTQIETRIPQPDTVSVPEKTTSYTIRDSPGFRHKQNQVLVQNFKGSEIGEFTISDLDSCEVKLIGCVNALFFNRLKNCKIYAGPVVGSILMEEVEDCVFVLASHQIRIHFAKRSDFYLRVRSRPIIEDSDGVRFANYCLKYEGIEEDLAVAMLDEETGNWANVDDFKWLRAMQSPNWSILPEEERVGDFDLTNSNSSTS